MALAAAAAAAAAAVSFPPLLSRPAAWVLLRCGRNGGFLPFFLGLYLPQLQAPGDFKITLGKPKAPAP
ncbi:hypothetical protein OsJ_09446 [Oryza sativa Japonica Group]|uniref:Uncharacterized protein n=1 Tax=Oryza sativa subsp. japonica TaxID=39947 RepID=B9FBD6_ORYSJ|nr:hypothetical protein OsJ_09446 [Oryza sativa Japonica Group]